MKNSYAFNRQSQSRHFLPHFLCFLLILGYVQFANAQCPMGHISLTTQAQIDNFTTDYPGCMHVLNNLVIGPSADIANLNGLSGVNQIDGALLVLDNSALTDVSGLNGLMSIGTEINIQSNPVLGSIDLSGVSAPNVNRFIISNNAMLTSALLPTNVITISDRLQYYNNPLLATISEMNSLTSVGDVLSISNVLANTLPAFNSLTEIGTNVPSVTSGLYLDTNPNITAIPVFPVLNSIGGLISIQINQNLTGFDLSAVSTHDMRMMIVNNNPVLVSALLPTDVTAISDRLQYYNNPLLATISEMNSLTSVGDVLSISNVLANTLPAFNSLTEIGTNVPSVTSGLYLDTNPNITAIPAFPVLNSIGGLISIQINQNLTGFDLSAVSTHDMRMMIVNNNPVLVSALLPTDVTAISNRLQYYNNPLLATISEMNSLTSVGDVLSISNVLANTLPAFNSLTEIGTNVPSVTSGLYLDTNPNITAIPAFPVLNSIGGSISIQINQNLTGFDLSAVSTHDIRSMFVNNNPALTSALLPTDVAAVAERLDYQDNPLLETVSAMTNLTSIGQYLTFYRTNACYLPDFPNLSSIGKGMVYGSNPKLKVLPKLDNGAVISELISIVDNPALGFCAIEAVCNFLQGAGTRNISGNAGACLDEAALTVSCLANDPYPDINPTLDPASIVNVQQGQQALLILANLQPGTAAVWYAEDQVTELYNDEANHFQPVINQVMTFHGVMLDNATGCISALLTVTICPDNLPLDITCPAGLPPLTANSSCQAFLGDYTSLATLSGGCDIPLNPIVQTPAPGSIVNPGTVAITLTVNNTAGQSATCVFNVVISGGCGD
ncbi:MAG: hypothetical protein IPM98_03965 [Lewinellaceae bacterium]|nr:hypothetical protein [Lewinellaceae bacterium]